MCRLAVSGNPGRVEPVKGRSSTVGLLCQYQEPHIASLEPKVWSIRVRYWSVLPVVMGLKSNDVPLLGSGTYLLSRLAEIGLKSAVGMLPVGKIVEYGVPAG